MTRLKLIDYYWRFLQFFSLLFFIIRLLMKWYSSIHQSFNENYSIHYSYCKISYARSERFPLNFSRQLRQEKTESRNWNEKLYFVACRHEKEKDVKLWWHGRGTREEVAKLRIIVASFCITFPNCTPRFKKKDYVAAAWRKNAGRNKNEARGKPWNATTRRGKRASFANLHFSRLSRDLAPCSVFSLIHEQGRDLTIEIQEK